MIEDDNEEEEEEEEEEINEQFRSFSVLEEKKDSIQKIDKSTKPSQKISDQNIISTEKNEKTVRIKILSDILFSSKPIFFRLNHHR
jgi:hypothetical protein